MVWIAALGLLLTGATGHGEALPAFPGAEGFGAYAVGGRGGAVYVVDTLDYSFAVTRPA